MDGRTRSLVLRVVLAIVFLAVLFGAGRFVRQAIGAKARIETLEEARRSLEEENRRLVEERDSAVAAHDSIGASLDSLAAVTDSIVAEGNETVEVLVREIVEVVPDSIARRIEEVDSIRLDQIERITERAVRAETAVDSLRAALFSERSLWSAERSNLEEQIANLQAQVDAAVAALPGNFIAEILDDPWAIAAGAVLGGAACYAFCPRDSKVVVASGASFSVPF